MYYALYDKDFQAIGAKKTYKCSKWSYTKRAYEFSDLKIEGAAIEDVTGATYVGLHEERGRLVVMMFSGIPETKNGITKINAIDIRQLLKTDAVIDLTDIDNLSTVKSVYNYLLDLLTKEYHNIGASIKIDTTELDIDPPAFREDLIVRTREVGNIWDTLQAVNSIYECFVDVEVDYLSKEIVFKIRRIIESIDIKLADFGALKIKNDFTKVNRAVCINDAYAEGTAEAEKEVYYLLSDDTVVSEADAIANYPNKIIYPPKIKLFQKKEIKDAKVAGVQELYKNRFKQNVEIPLENQMAHLLKGVDLNWKANIYELNKTLPVMEIYRDEKNKRRIKFGRLEEYWWL